MILCHVLRAYHKRDLVGSIITVNMFWKFDIIHASAVVKVAHFLNLGSGTIKTWMWACLDGSPVNVVSPRLGRANQV